MERESRLYFYAKDATKSHNLSNIKLRSSEAVENNFTIFKQTYYPEGLARDRSTKSQVMFKSPGGESNSGISYSSDSHIYGFMQGINQDSQEFSIRPMSNTQAGYFKIKTPNSHA